MKRLVALFLLIVGFSACEKDPPIPLPPENFELNTLLSTYNVPGAAIVAWDDDSLFQTYGGVADVRSNQPVHAGTVFEMASLSKTAVAFLACILDAEGVLDLDQPLYNYWKGNNNFKPSVDTRFSDLNEFAAYEKTDTNFKKITARQCLSHKSGLGDWSLPVFMSFPPGKGFHYSGDGYMYYQRVLEFVTQKDLESLFKEKVALPYGVESLTFLLKENTPNVVGGHEEDGHFKREIWYAREPISVGSLCGTALDFVKLLRVMKASPFQDLFKGEIVIDKNMGWTVGSGYTNYEEPAIWHVGSDTYFKCFFFYRYNSDKGYLICTNSINGFELMQDYLSEKTHENAFHIWRRFT